MSTLRLFWGIFWRSVLWYTAAGAVFGGLYGCAFLTAMILSSGLLGEVSFLAFGCFAGVVILLYVALGLMLARRVKIPVLAASVLCVLGIFALPGLLVVPYSIFAFAIGTVCGSAYGLAVGLVNALALAVVIRLRFTTLGKPEFRRAIVTTSMLSVLVIPLLCLLWILWEQFIQRSTPVDGAFAYAGVMIFYAGIPALVLAAAARILGGRIVHWCQRETQNKQ